MLMLTLISEQGSRVMKRKNLQTIMGSPLAWSTISTQCGWIGCKRTGRMCQSKRQNCESLHHTIRIESATVNILCFFFFFFVEVQFNLPLCATVYRLVPSCKSHELIYLCNVRSKTEWKYPYFIDFNN